MVTRARELLYKELEFLEYIQDDAMGQILWYRVTRSHELQAPLLTAQEK